MASKVSLQILRKGFTRNFFIHLLVWLLYIGYEVLIVLIAKFPFKPYVTIISFTINILLFYFCADYIFPVFFKKEKILRFIGLILLALTVYIAIFMVIDWNIVPAWLDKPKDVLGYFYILIRGSRGIRFIAYATAYWVIRKLITAERDNNVLLKKRYTQELREKELRRVVVTTELGYVRAQINPHFLFNTLNFLYLNTKPLSKDIAKSVLMLSDIMRFVMENNKNNGPIDLSLEIKHIENYIKLNQLRFHHNLYIDFEYTGTPENKKIIPFILMTLVENAFKHGDLTDAKHPLKIRLDMLSERVTFRVSNKVNAVGLYEQHGIGMNNVEKCLELFYDHKFKLDIQNDGRHYNCELEVEL
jgi:two-component system LytT family sensor kinase